MAKTPCEVGKVSIDVNIGSKKFYNIHGLKTEKVFCFGVKSIRGKKKTQQ